MPRIHDAAWNRSLPTMSLDPSMKPGMANISSAVASLPHQLTSKRCMPKTMVATAMVTPTSTSRTSTATQNHSGASAVDDDRHEGDDEHEAVDGRVELLAELTHLAEPPGEVAVDPVGRAEPTEQPGGTGAVVAGEQQPQEDREAQQAQEREQVGDGEQRVDLALVPSHAVIVTGLVLSDA